MITKYLVFAISTIMAIVFLGQSLLCKLTVFSLSISLFLGVFFLVFAIFLFFSILFSEVKPEELTKPQIKLE